MSKVVTFDIELVQYRRIYDVDSGSEAWNFKFDIDSDAVRDRRNIYIEVQNFDIVLSRYRRFIDIDKCLFDI